MDRTVLIADEGMVYTDGIIYGRKIYLAEGQSGENFTQIPLENLDDGEQVPEF